VWEERAQERVPVHRPALPGGRRAPPARRGRGPGRAASATASGAGARPLRCRAGCARAGGARAAGRACRLRPRGRLARLRGRRGASAGRRLAASARRRNRSPGDTMRVSAVRAQRCRARKRPTTLRANELRRRPPTRLPLARTHRSLLPLGHLLNLPSVSICRRAPTCVLTPDAASHLPGKEDCDRERRSVTH
jgi:hypothetical protein